MGLFHQNFDKPGPGVSPMHPRKKGAARFFEILGRDFSTIWMAGLLALISSLPFALLLWLAVSTHSLIPLLAAGHSGRHDRRTADRRPERHDSAQPAR